MTEAANRSPNTEAGRKEVPPGAAPEVERPVAEAPEAEAPEAETAAAQARTSDRGNGAWRWLVLNLMVLAAGFGGLVWWLDGREQALEQQLLERTGDQGGRLQDLDARLDALARQQRELAAGGEANAARLEELTASVSKLYTERSGEDLTAMLAEIEQLVFVASQRLQIERDPVTAIAALQSADRRLREAAHPDLAPLRQAIIGDLSALQAVNMPDLEGQALYLADLVERVGALPLRSLEFSVAGDAAAPEATAGEPLWRQLWRELVSIVDVERLEVPDAVLVDPAGRRMLFDAVRLELVTARNAVLRRDTDNMVASLRIVDGLLSAYFDSRDGGVASIRERLKQMQTLDLAPALPSVKRSLDAIRGLRGQLQ